jgi:hypothetical protein
MNSPQKKLKKEVGTLCNFSESNRYTNMKGKKKKELGPYEFECAKCGKVHKKSGYAIAQGAMGVELIHTCDCGGKTRL